MTSEQKKAALDALAEAQIGLDNAAQCTSEGNTAQADAWLRYVIMAVRFARQTLDGK